MQVLMLVCVGVCVCEREREREERERELYSEFCRSGGSRGRTRTDSASSYGEGCLLHNVIDIVCFHYKHIPNI